MTDSAHRNPPAPQGKSAVRLEASGVSYQLLVALGAVAMVDGVAIETTPGEGSNIPEVRSMKLQLAEP